MEDEAGVGVGGESGLNRLNVVELGGNLGIDDGRGESGGN